MKIKVKIGTPDIQKCAFCRNWIGDAQINMVGIGIYCYNDSAVGLCRLHKKGNKCSNYVCNDLDVGYEFL